jgi:chemotaxis protein MotB
MSSEARAKQAPQGAPAWIVTFADLMSLLMCFFVLLLAFSEMDVSKYKEMAGSLRNAFGVQRDIQAKEPPKGINVIAREFSPARPEPTQLNVIRQMTTNDLRVNLDLGKERRRPAPTRRTRTPTRRRAKKPTSRPAKRAVITPSGRPASSAVRRTV